MLLDLEEWQCKYLGQLANADTLWTKPPGQYSEAMLDEYELHAYGLPTTQSRLQAWLP